MTDFVDDEIKLPSLWRVKAQAYVWTIFMGAIFFAALFAVRQHINVNFGGLMTAADARMTVIWLLVIVGSLIFNKVYFALNPQIYQNNTQQIRQINDKLNRLLRLEQPVHEIRDWFITYADKIPEA